MPARYNAYVIWRYRTMDAMCIFVGELQTVESIRPLKYGEMVAQKDVRWAMSEKGEKVISELQKIFYTGNKQAIIKP